MINPSSEWSPAHPIWEVYRRCRDTFQVAGIPFAPYVHEAVFDYETAEVVRSQFDLSGAETKSLFLRTKSGRYAMWISLEAARIDPKVARIALGAKVSMASAEELERKTACIAGCAVPLGLPKDISLLVDQRLGSAEKLIFSPGPPTQTVEVTAAEWDELLTVCANEVLVYDAR
jgi:Ala-tRNA(Pro) deacylase